MRKELQVVLLTFMVAGAVALGQTRTTADQGKPGTQGPWPVTVSGGGATDGGIALTTQAAHGACTNTTMTIGTSSLPCPGDAGAGSLARADRASLMIELQQVGETLTITEDGTAASATNGTAIGNGSALTDNLAGSVAAQCRCTAASCSVRITECPP